MTWRKVVRMVLLVVLMAREEPLVLLPLTALTVQLALMMVTRALAVPIKLMTLTA